MASGTTSEGIGQSVIRLIWFLAFWGYLGVKIGGVTFATWSYWWLLLPVVPWFALAAKHWGL